MMIPTVSLPVRLHPPGERDSEDRCLHLHDLCDQMVDEVPFREALADRVRPRHELDVRALRRAGDSAERRLRLGDGGQERGVNLRVEVRMSGVDDPAAEGRDARSRCDLISERHWHEALVDLHAEHAGRRLHLQHVAGELRRIVVVLVALLPRVRVDAGVRGREQALVLRVGNDVVLPVESERMREPDVAARQPARVLRGNNPTG